MCSELFIAHATFVVLKAWKLLSQHEVYCQVFAPAKHSPSSQSLPRTWKEAFHLVPLELDNWPRLRFFFAAVVSHSIAFDATYNTAIQDCVYLTLGCSHVWIQTYQTFFLIHVEQESFTVGLQKLHTDRQFCFTLYYLPSLIIIEVSFTTLISQ